MEDDIAKSMETLNIEAGAAESSSTKFKRKPVIIIVVGLPGTGKTTFVCRLIRRTQAFFMRRYVINLDPAVMIAEFTANVDIRDTVKYKEVMKQFNLGPNDGILKSLDLFSTKIDEVISDIERRADELDYVFVDTSGQIKNFPLTAPGARITEAFASTFPTIITFVADARVTCPYMFMSNILYAGGIVYEKRFPVVLAFNKIDVAQYLIALEWMEDFEAFKAALNSRFSYHTELLEFPVEHWYKNVKSVAVSAVSAAGMEDFFKAIDEIAKEAEKQRLEEKLRRKEMEKPRKDMERSREETVVLSTGLKDRETGSKAMMDEEDEE